MSLFSLVNRKDRRSLRKDPLAQEILGPYNPGNEPYETGYTYSNAFGNPGLNDNPVHLGSTYNGVPEGGWKNYLPSLHAPVYDMNTWGGGRGSNWSQLYKVPWNSKTNSIDPNSTDRRFFRQSKNTIINDRQFNRTDLNMDMHRDIYKNRLNPSDSLSTQEVYDILESENYKSYNQEYDKYLK